MRLLTAFKGATAYEWQIGPLWGRFAFRRYWRHTPLVQLGWDKSWRDT